MLHSGGQNQKRPTSGWIGYVTLAVSPPPTSESGGNNHKWPSSGWIGYVTLAISRFSNASELGTKAAHEWADWLRNPCYLGVPKRLTAGEQNEKWHASGWIGYVIPTVWGVHNASGQGAK